MNKLIPYSLPLLLVLVPIHVSSDVTIEQRIKVEARGLISVFESEKTRLTQISGDRARIEAFDGIGSAKAEETSIIHLQPDLGWVLYPAQQQFETKQLGQIRAEAERDIALIEEMPTSGPDALPINEQVCQWTPPRVEMERTREKTKIAGIKAEQHLATVASTCNIPSTKQSCDVTWVLDYWNARRIPGVREIDNFRSELADRLGTLELLAFTPVIPQGLLALFEDGWEEAMYEADGLKGFPVKTVMSLHIGGDDCRTRSNKEITRNSVWTNVKKDSVQATKNSAANTAGSIAAGQVFRKVGGGLGGMIAGGAAEIFTRNSANKAMNKEEEGPGPVTVGSENLAERIDGQVQIFRITTELYSIDENTVPDSRLEVPDGWEEL
jgi:hypothetical protein